MEGGMAVGMVIACGGGAECPRKGENQVQIGAGAGVLNFLYGYFRGRRSYMYVRWIFRYSVIRGNSGGQASIMVIIGMNFLFYVCWIQNCTLLLSSMNEV